MVEFWTGNEGSFFFFFFLNPLLLAGTLNHFMSALVGEVTKNGGDTLKFAGESFFGIGMPSMRMAKLWLLPF